MSLYRSILKQSWHTTWKSKNFWFFGLFAALLGGGGEYEVLFKGLSGEFQKDFLLGIREFFATGFFSLNGLSNLGRKMIEEPMTVLAVFTVLTLITGLIIFLIWLSNVSQIALVKNALLRVSKKDSNFQGGMNTGIKKFWPVFFLNILTKIFIFVVFGLISLLVITTASVTNTIAINFVYILSFVVLIPVVMSFSYIIKYAIGYVVIQDMSLGESLRSGLELFKKNWLISLEMSFVLLIISIMVMILFSASFLLFVIPFAFLGVIATGLNMAGIFWLVAMFSVIFLIFLTIVLSAVLTTFQVSTWTTLFIELISRGAKSKIVRIFS